MNCVVLLVEIRTLRLAVFFTRRSSLSHLSLSTFSSVWSLSVSRNNLSLDGALCLAKFRVAVAGSGQVRNHLA